MNPNPTNVLKEIIPKSNWKYISACFVTEYFYQRKLEYSSKTKLFIFFSFLREGER